MIWFTSIRALGPAEADHIVVTAALTIRTVLNTISTEHLASVFRQCGAGVWTHAASQMEHQTAAFATMTADRSLQKGP